MTDNNNFKLRMQQATSDNRRIAKNTLMLYMRMLLSMMVSIYTSRIVLNVLGIEDYGIYNIVGSVVGILSFLNASMSGATSRFLAFEIGRGDSIRLKDTFCSAFIIHIGVAILIFIIAETLGLWVLYNKLTIPSERIYAAHWVYQLSIITMAIGITQVPYNASIIAHEKMDIYAYVEILNVILKLVIVFMLGIGNVDKLISYATLTLCVTIVITMIYRIYCIKNFDECRLNFIWKRSILRPMLSLSGWDLLGHLGYTIRLYGTNMLLNIFFGPAVNAASGIATVVQSAISGFSANVITAVRPSIIKSYATNDIRRFDTLLTNTSYFTLLIMMVITGPVLLNLSLIMTTWLTTVPKYCIDFTFLCLLSNCISAYASILYIGIHSTGKLMFSSLFRNILYILSIAILFILLKLEYIPQTAYVLLLITQALVGIVDSLLLHSYVKSFNLKPILKNLLIAILAFTISFIVGQKIKGNVSSIAGFFLSSISFVVIFFFIIWTLGMSSQQRLLIKVTINKYVKRVKA